MSSEEIISIVSMTARKGKADSLRELAISLTGSTRANDAGCINYTFQQRLDNPDEFIIYERWLDAASLEAHLARLNSVYGPPTPGEIFPPAILELLEKAEVINLRAVE
jgi:quinol monooxygenase YgiN